MTKIKVTNKKLSINITKSSLSKKIIIEVRYDKNQVYQEKLNKNMTKTKVV